MELTGAEILGTLQRPRMDRERGCLVGSRCRECGIPSWPGRAYCFSCGSSDVEEAAFSTGGLLGTFTTVWVERPGLEAPYTLGQVTLADGVSLYAHVRGLAEDARVPLPVHLVLADGDDAFPAFWFEPDGAGEQ
ncbi:MAG TPA: zinc ribbon domain-containing protein [Gaiellaceae bacterium]|nr:zinc ribbon domain-containing protein [Gaiellaceae bacterium]